MSTNDTLRGRFLAWLPKYWNRETFIDDEGDELFIEDWVQGAWVGYSAALAEPSVEAAEIEVVGYCRPVNISLMKAGKFTGFMVNDEESSAINCALMTVAQHRRILAGVKQQAGSGVPEGWQARFTLSGDSWDAWQTCSKEHHDLVKRCPREWPGYEVREIYAAPLPPSPADKADS